MKQPDFSVSIACSKSALNEDIIVSYTTQFGKLVKSAETRYPADEGEALLTEYNKGISALGELIELEAKNNPLIKQDTKI